MSQELVNSVNKLTDETSALLQEYVKGNTVLQNSASEAASSAAAAKVSEGITIDKANVATQKAAEAKQFRDETAAVATGGTATLDPTPGKIPLADSQGKIDAGWLGWDNASIAIVLLSGGRLELIKDVFGNAHLFGIIPIQAYEQQGIPGCPFTGIIDAFRKADGTYLSEKRIAIHKSVNVGGKTVSQAGKAPYVSLNFDEFKTKAAELGAGFRLLDIFDNALVNWIILGIIARGGQAPRGNTEWGRAHNAIHEIGARVDGQVSNTRSGNGATLTGSGPHSWNHDGTAHGFSDWVGNVWEWVDGLKMSGGELVVAEYSGQPESEWLRTGRYINAGHVFSMTAPPSPVASSARWGSFGKTSDYVGHELLQRLMIEPIDCTKVLNGNFWYNTDGERSPIARADWSNGAGAGPVALNLHNPRSHRISLIGGRLAFGS
ncbi:hypothetical protein LO82_13635 [Vibrio vulnificus]|uniref:hypothetical protein n=1 Tax=Vibrio vulnificus TaxID=672 RepID=UPI0006AD2523|nr:hypothetical protein [Vibrio vulnificus]KOR97272.1 hypothetical protein LO82_13635 [Vibrio vulnificus]